MKSRERPRCRKFIIERGLRPLLDREGAWDRHRAVHPDGTPSFLSDGMRLQMRRMLEEGYFNTPPSGIPIMVGVRVPPLPDDEILDETDGLRIVLVKPESSMDQKHRVEPVSIAANGGRDLDIDRYRPNESGDYTFKRHALLALKDDLAVALLIVERHRFWGGELRAGDDASSSKDRRWYIDYIWVFPDHRRQGIGTRLARAVSAFTGARIQDLVWRKPFSPDYEAFLKRISPGEYRTPARFCYFERHANPETPKG